MYKTRLCTIYGTVWKMYAHVSMSLSAMEWRCVTSACRNAEPFEESTQEADSLLKIIAKDESWVVASNSRNDTQTHHLKEREICGSQNLCRTLMLFFRVLRVVH